MLWCRPCSPAPSTGFGQPGGKQPGGEDGALGWAECWEPVLSRWSSTCCPPSPRDSLRVFSSLCQIFSEEDNYSQSRELLLRVRPYSLALLAIPAPPPPSFPLFCHPQEVKGQPSLEPSSRKALKSGTRGGVSAGVVVKEEGVCGVCSQRGGKRHGREPSGQWQGCLTDLCHRVWSHTLAPS